MSIPISKPVLIVGGSGLVGSRAARVLRRLQPDLPITIGGRDVARAAAVAREIGRADALGIDLARPDLGLSPGTVFSAIALFVKDDTLEALRFAQRIGAAYLSISSGVFEMAPEVALYVAHPERAPVVMASHWLAGAVAWPALHFAREYRNIDRIDLAALLDPEDIGGPAAYADYERLTTVATSALIREDGEWRWLPTRGTERSFRDSGGTEHQGQAYTPFDVVSLGAATNARSIRFDLALGQTPSHRRGEGLSVETYIEIRGERLDGRTAHVRHELVHPGGQAPLTASAVALLLERLVGASGSTPLPPGLYFPENILEPESAFARLQEFGLRHRAVTA